MDNAPISSILVPNNGSNQQLAGSGRLKGSGDSNSPAPEVTQDLSNLFTKVNEIAAEASEATKKTKNTENLVLLGFFVIALMVAGLCFDYFQWSIHSYAEYSSTLREVQNDRKNSLEERLNTVEQQTRMCRF